MDSLDITRRWVENVVVELNLCPFARRELIGGKVRFSETGAIDIESLLQALVEELEYLNLHPEIETTLLIHPKVLTEFSDYNPFLDLADALLCDMQLQGVYQIASFHPGYRFAGTRKEDAENYSNRSPFPMLHLIREASLERAIAGYPDPQNIPERNIALLNKLGRNTLQAALENCFVRAAYSHKES